MENPKYTLSAPISFNGETYSELTFREPDVGCMVDAEAAGGGEQTYMCALLAAMCDMPFDAFRKIRAGDLRRIMKATAQLVRNFDQGGEETGETSPS
ncbi:phage tail assembly protein [Arvimicrobium flavum]|uniref:phage tail assembly protein n=1 Tax=Arvimicrobium flavum TaxID=3393320 RepID=UPI00237B32F9|nr:phage tail assembly protein [Mesorhizobium shangrilense]